MFARRSAPSEYGAAYLGHNLPERLPAGSVFGAWVRVQNTGARTWLRDHPEGHGVDLVIHCGDRVWATHRLPRAQVRTGEIVTVHFALHAPPAAGRHALAVGLVEQGIALFEGRGVAPLRIALETEQSRPTASAALFAQAARTSPWHYQPARGIQRSAHGGTYPLFATRASGCHLWDAEGRRYVDYVMGWGSALLGYNPPAVREAIAAVLEECAPVLPLPHPLEIEVSRMLTEDIPSAEMVVFGKNGSDVCTVAVRVARAYTGRSVILCCGYHGWQDWWVEQAGFAATGVPARPTPLVHGFRFNDLQDFTRLFAAHRGDLAAVMLEPAGPADGPGGPFRDADPHFLAAAAAMARDAGALVIYDEIMTGFRYRDGSVQQATGVVPDLTCLGKALGAGMPLSALVGRAAVMEVAMGRTHYGPTYRGEVYSLAAARAALAVYRREPVAAHVWAYGERLRADVNALCVEAGVGARLVGPPFRMGLVIDAPDADTARLARGLYRQELLRAGVVTYDGVMLPSYAHDDAALTATLAAVRQAVEAVGRAAREGDLDRYLEVPPD